MTFRVRIFRDHNGFNLVHIQSGHGIFFPTAADAKEFLRERGGNFFDRAFREIVREIIRRDPDVNIPAQTRDFDFVEEGATTTWQ